MASGKRFTILILIMSFLLTSMVSTYASADTPSGWAIDDINYLRDLNLLRDDMFYNYQTNITREDYAYLVYKLVESYDVAISEIADLDMAYTLTDCDDYYVIGLYKADIITGYLDGTFRPKQSITRQEICTLYMKALEVMGVDLVNNAGVLDAYQDSNSIGSWAVTSMVKCINAGIINGTSSTWLSPQGYATIEQSLVVLNRIMSNDSITNQISPFQKSVESSSIAYDDGYYYYASKNLLGETVSIKQYKDFELVKEISAAILESTSGVSLQGDIQVVDGYIYYLNSQGWLSAYNLLNSQVTRIDTNDCKDFIVLGQTIYVLLSGDVYTYDIEADHTYINKSLVISGTYTNIKGYQFSTSIEDDFGLYLLDDSDNLVLYHNGNMTPISAGVQSYEISNEYIYYIYSDQILYKQKIDSTVREEIAQNAYEFRVCGYNILYISQGGKLYNISKYIQTNLLYEGDLFGLELDHNYLEVTEMLVGETTYNHLIALFYTTEYFGY